MISRNQMPPDTVLMSASPDAAFMMALSRADRQEHVGARVLALAPRPGDQKDGRREDDKAR